MSRKIAVIWDMENSPIHKPKEDAEKLKLQLERKFPGASIESHVFFCEGGSLHEEQRRFSEIEGFHVHELPKNGKDAADYAIMSYMFDFAAKNPESPLILLIGGDEDFTKSVNTLDGLKYNVFTTTKGSACRMLKRMNIHLSWESVINGTASFTKSDQTNKSLTYNITNTSLLEQKDSPVVGVYIDLDSMEVNEWQHFELLNRVMGYVCDLEGGLVEFRAFGNKLKFPANYPNTQPGTEKWVRDMYINTSRVKYNRTENNIIAAMGRFIIEAHEKSKVLVIITSNIRFSTTINTFAELGYKVMLVTPNQGHELKQAVSKKIYWCKEWDEMPDQPY